MSSQHVPVRSERFRVRSYEVDAAGFATLPTLCNLFQEAADRHASELGVAVDQIVAAHRETWMLYRLALRCASPPRWRDEVTVETWPCGQERLYAVREYRLLAADGRTLAEGATAWLVVDLDTRRITRSPRTRIDWRAGRGRAMPDAFRGRLPALDGAAAHAAEFAVRRGEIDVNGHVNHVHYVAWALDAAPAACWEGSRPVAFEAEYVAEALPGDAVRARSAPCEGDAWAHEVTNAADGRVLLRARSAWAPTA